MDINDDYNPRRIPDHHESTINQRPNDENAENQLLGIYQHQRLEENANNEWAMNGIKNRPMYMYQEKQNEQQQQYEEHDMEHHHHRGGGGDNVRSIAGYGKTTTTGESFNDILNSNRQNMEGSLLNKNLGNTYDSGNKYGGGGGGSSNRVQSLPMLSEDLRISKIIRRLMIENNRRAALELCKKLEAAVRNQANSSYVCRSFDILFDNMLTVLRQCPLECLEHASSILGVMGYINRYDFAIYKGHLTKAYGTYKNIRKYLMMALKTTLRCDAVNLDLKTYSERLLSLLKEYLENAEITENFISICDTISEFSKNYKQSFQKHFTDIVDIIIGWHLEVEQPTMLKRHCAKVLQQFATYFLNELDFTFGLLGQFIEDIEACREEIMAEDCTVKIKQQTENRVGAFIGAFTSIIKALASKGVNLNEFGTAATILLNAKQVVNKVAKQCFQQLPLISEETVTNLNEFYCMILFYDKSVENLYDFEGIIELQLQHLAAFNDNQQSSFLYMILNIIRQYRTQLPLSFVTLIMNTENTVLQDLKLSCGSKPYKLLMKIYHEILIIKNVPLLQEAYRHILKDINDTIKKLEMSETSSQAQMINEMLLNFYLASLAALACQTSSIIGMYALNPSILELLINNCQASNGKIWSKYPTSHQALLELIIEHSMKNHNFRQSSRLLKQHQDSPSSENFAMILKFFNEIFKWHVSVELFKWLEQILEECQEDYDVLTQKEDFLSICENITEAALKQPLVCSTILETLLKYPKIPVYILSNIRDIALYITESTDKNLSSIYSQILALLPLEIALTPNHDKQLFCKNKEKLFLLFQWHKSSICFNPLRPKYFKPFLESLDPNSTTNSSIYQSFMEKSSCNLPRDHFQEYLQTLQDNQQLLSCHLQYEAARYCVQQKLRTTLGKPQETFLGIEAIIMKYARFLAEKEGLPLQYRNLQNVMEVQQNCRMLLGFLENLEKHIYNAAEGCAYAMLPAEKPAKTFFRVNAPTCREWFKRIRTAVNLIALNCMEPEMVIRYSENILQIEANHNNQALLDRTVTSLVWALFSCGESDTLYGLTTWLKTKHGKRYEWIQYVAEQATGHLEKAATGYQYALHDENNKIMDPYMKEFIQKQLTECLYYTARWSEISSITQENIYSKQHLDIMESIYQTSNSQKYNMENQELSKALIDLTEWPAETALENNKKYTAKLETYSYYDVLRKLQDSCLMEAKSNDSKEGLYESIRNCVQQGISEGLMHSYEPGFNNNQLNELMIINHISYKLKEHKDITISSNDNNLDAKMSSLLLTKSFYCSLTMDQQATKQQYNLLLNLSSKARIENNFNYCHSLLTKFFKMKSINLPLNEIAQQLKTKQLSINYNDLVLIQGIEELVKCLQAETTSISEALELGSACCSEIIQLQQTDQTSENSFYPSSISNLLLTMADWLTIHRLNNSNLTNGLQFQKLQNQLPDIPFCSHSENSKCNLLPSSEYSVGKLLSASILCKQDSGEAWLSFGNWCYRWGKKLMEAKQSEQSAITTTTTALSDVKDIKLTKRNIMAIHDILKDKFDAELIQQIVDLINNHIINAINDDNVEDLYSNSQNTTEILERELQNVCSLNTDQLNAIVAIWRQAHKGVYGFYEESTRAYFKYLAIESDTAAVTKMCNSDDDEVEDCTFVTTTLRLLRLIVKHAIGLQDVLEEGLRNTPLRPWKVIVPQLFSRLNHHEPYVRQSVSELLCRLAVNQPQLIIFPAVVGAQQELKLRNNTDTQVQLSNCFGTLLNSLAQQAPETVLQVQLLVKELRRITLLWEEYWIHSLAQLYSEYSPLYNALDAEAKKSNNSELMLAKYEVFRHHLLTDFNKIAAITDREPETNYERTFQERFRPHIDLVLKELQKTLEVAKASECWQKIKQLYTLFQQRPLRGNSSTLRITDISPVLANMHNTTIAMPGVDTYEQPAVYIKSVDTTVFILPTKTKPKKLSLYGSNGQRYTYLFKGQEDLHLDERIMQFLSISNSMMAKSYGSKSKTDCFKAHHYSVIPLGSQSGLISWVDNCTPLFAIYKKWQQRDALLKQQQKERQSSAAKGNEQLQQSPVAANATRPSELFYNKLTPLLTECNLKVTDPRRQWPMPVLKRVLKELVSETPKDLLAKEIWCFSANAVEWRKSVRRYSMSMAVMSIIGYVIGLGDRHLDNVLIKLATGEIVHIDYNVCFEKGKTLRVPEKVPFRMTQNLKDALGLVGTEGAFRLACSHVLKILRKERETLLTLLEAFVYDPLVDWTISDDGTTTVSRGTSAHNAANIIASLDINSTTQHLSPKELYKNRKLEVDLSRQTLALRITEIKPAWLKYKNDFDMQLNDIDLHLQHVFEYRNEIIELEQERDNFTKQQAMVRELEALGTARDSHALNTVNQRYAVYKRDLESFNKVKLIIQQTVKDLDLVLMTYFTILLNSEEINKIDINPRENSINAHNNSEFDLIKDLLVLNSWTHMYTQAKYTKHEMENTFIQTQRSSLECRDLLMFYSRVMEYQPRSELQRNRLIKYKKSYSDLLELSNTAEYLKDIEIKRKNIEYCGQYFECMTIIAMEMQKNLVQAKHILEEHKQQPIILSSIALNALNDFISLNPTYNTQILIISMLRHITEASQVFKQHEQTLLQNHDYFLLKQQLNFLQLIDKFVNCVYPSFKQSQNSDIIHLLINSFKSLLYLRDNMESLIGKICSTYMMDDNLELQNYLNEFVLGTDFGIADNCQQLKAIFEIIDASFEKFELSLQALQQKIAFLQDNQTNSGNEHIMNLWNIDIESYLKKSRNDLLIKLFTSLKQSAESLKTNDINNIYDLRKIRYPIDDLVYHMQSALFDGLLSYAIQDINTNITNALIPLDTVNEIDLSNADLLCGNLYVSLQHETLLQFDESLIIYHSQLLEQHHVVTTAYCWLNDEYLKDIPDTHNYITTKHEFLSRLHNISQVLVVWKSTMLKIQADLELRRNSINDLLQTLSPTDEVVIKQQQFRDFISIANQRYSFFLNLSTNLSEYSAVLLQFEISSGDHAFEELVKRFETERQKLLQSESSITVVERNLVQLLDPEDKIDQCWIENVSGLLDEMIFSVQKKIVDMEKEDQSMEKMLLADGQQLQFLLDSTMRLDLRQLLKMLTKSYKQTSKSDTGESFQDLRDIQQSLKLLQTKLNELQAQLFAREFDTPSIKQIEEKVTELRILVQHNNDGLNLLIERFLQMDVEREQQQRSDSPAVSPTRNEQANKEVVNSQIGEQKRNAYAVSVWKRIRMKLEGRDPDPNRRNSVAEQVDFVIREATNEENLASLYEGWTPWV